MHSKQLVALAGLSVALLIGAALVALIPQPQQAPVESTGEGLSLYANGTYGFSLAYPAQAPLHETFTATYHLGTAWRARALPDGAGEPIVEIVAYSIESENSYPRYYHALVRIGASTDAAEVARCLVAENGEVALPDVTIGGHVFKAFSFEDAGMQQYVRGVSYRTVHEGACVALEKVAAGSSYRDDQDRAAILDAVLEQAYTDLDAIIETFQFSRE